MLVVVRGCDGNALNMSEQGDHLIYIDSSSVDALVASHGVRGCDGDAPNMSEQGNSHASGSPGA